MEPGAQVPGRTPPGQPGAGDLPWGWGQDPHGHVSSFFPLQGVCPTGWQHSSKETSESWRQREASSGDFSPCLSGSLEVC